MPACTLHIRLDYFPVIIYLLKANSPVNRTGSPQLRAFTSLSQCNAREISGCFPRGKRSAVARRYPASLALSPPPPSLCVQCFRVFTPPAVRPSPLRQIDMGSLTCAQTWVRALHIYIYTRKGGQGTNKSAQELARRDRKKPVHHPAPPGDRTQGSSDVNPDSLSNH